MESLTSFEIRGDTLVDTSEPKIDVRELDYTNLVEALVLSFKKYFKRKLDGYTHAQFVAMIPNLEPVEALLDRSDEKLKEGQRRRDQAINRLLPELANALNPSGDDTKDWDRLNERLTVLNNNTKIFHGVTAMHGEYRALLKMVENRALTSRARIHSMLTNDEVPRFRYPDGLTAKQEAHYCVLLFCCFILPGVVLLEQYPDGRTERTGSVMVRLRKALVTTISDDNAATWFENAIGEYMAAIEEDVELVLGAQQLIHQKLKDIAKREWGVKASGS